MKIDLFSEYSDQLDNIVANPPVNNPAYTDSGKVRIKYFSLTAVAALAADSVVGLALIPPNARIMGGAYQHSAFGSSRTLDFGIYGADGTGFYNADEDAADDIDFFVDGDDVSSAGQDSIAELVNGDLNADYVTEKEVAIAVKILGDTMPIAGTLTGHIKYVVN